MQTGFKFHHGFMEEDYVSLLIESVCLLAVPIIYQGKVAIDQHTTPFAIKVFVHLVFDTPGFRLV